MQTLIALSYSCHFIVGVPVLRELGKRDNKSCHNRYLRGSSLTSCIS